MGRKDREDFRNEEVTEWDLRFTSALLELEKDDD